MRTIRGKLALAFLLVITVCLVPTSAAAAYVIRNYQRQDALERLSNFGETVAGAALTPRLSGLTPAEIVNLFADQRSSNALIPDQRNANTLILVTDARGVVLADNQNRYVGKVWPVPQNRPEARPVPLRPEYKGQLTAPDGATLAVATYRIDRRFTRPTATPTAVTPSGDQQAATSTYLVVAVPWNALTNAWGVIGMRLKWIVAAALLLSVFVAFVLSRSLTSRLQTLTQGAHAMARGDYDRAMRLAAVGNERDEVGDLAAAFRTMATSVSRAQRAQRDLVANVSHELKTPLTSIQGFSQAMVDGTVTDDGEYQDLAQIIQQEAQRMRRLVEQMLELSRLESGSVRLDLAPMRVDELVENVGKRYVRLGETKGVTVRWAAPANVTLVADAGRLEQVLVNLLDNALEYTNTGGSVTLFAQSARPNRVEFVIQDTGRGIPAEDVPRLFERFYQVERSRTGQGKHVGLGLAIVREIVDAHHGDIAVTSIVGQGTTITVAVDAGMSATTRIEAQRTSDGFAPETRATAVG